MGLGAGVALGQMMAQTAAGPAGAARRGVKPADVMATIEKLGELKAKGILTEEEFAAKKAELLKKLSDRSAHGLALHRRVATTPQRACRAACPNCGAPVEFRSAASASAVCSFCRSTLVRDGEALRRIGHSAELFDDHSPLQLGAAGPLPGRRLHAGRPPAVRQRRRPLERVARAVRQRPRRLAVGGQRRLRLRVRRAAARRRARRR